MHVFSLPPFQLLLMYIRPSEKLIGANSASDLEVPCSFRRSISARGRQSPMASMSRDSWLRPRCLVSCIHASKSKDLSTTRVFRIRSLWGCLPSCWECLWVCLWGCLALEWAPLCARAQIQQYSHHEYTCIPTYIYIHIPRYMYIYIYVNIYIYIYIHAYRL